MIHYQRFTRNQAKEFVDSIDRLNDISFNDKKAQWLANKVDDYDLSYQDLRESVLQAFHEDKDPQSYATDLNVGFCLYQKLNAENGFTNVKANDDDIWRYLSCKVFPDITYIRYPSPKAGDIRLNSKRFYSHTRRIWLKTLWWFIHLSWQGTVASTYKVLKNCGTNLISQLIERPGKGYRLELFREIMKQYSTQKPSQAFFKSMQKQNLVNCKTIEPALTEQAEKGYVESLILQVRVGDEKNGIR